MVALLTELAALESPTDDPQATGRVLDRLSRELGRAASPFAGCADADRPVFWWRIRPRASDASRCNCSSAIATPSGRSVPSVRCRCRWSRIKSAAPESST